MGTEPRNPGARPLLSPLHPSSHTAEGGQLLAAHLCQIHQRVCLVVQLPLLHFHAPQSRAKEATLGQWPHTAGGRKGAWGGPSRMTCTALQSLDPDAQPCSCRMRRPRGGRYPHAWCTFQVLSRHALPESKSPSDTATPQHAPGAGAGQTINLCGCLGAKRYLRPRGARVGKWGSGPTGEPPHDSQMAVLQNRCHADRPGSGAEKPSEFRC